MNRRNFLQLLGLSALPIPALAVPTVEPTVPTVEGDSADWMILETPLRGAYSVEIDNQRVACLQDSTAEDAKQHIQWCTDMGVFTVNEFLLVSKKSKVTVTAPSGQRVWFHPQWDAVGERFETVVIEVQSHHDIYFNAEGDTTEERYTEMTACNTDGKLITKSIKDGI